MRNLRKHIEKIYRKVAYKVVHDKMSGISITDSNLSDYVGKPVFTSEKMYPDTPPGKNKINYLCFHRSRC